MIFNGLTNARVRKFKMIYKEWEKGSRSFLKLTRLLLGENQHQALSHFPRCAPSALSLQRPPSLHPPPSQFVFFQNNSKNIFITN